MPAACPGDKCAARHGCVSVVKVFLTDVVCVVQFEARRCFAQIAQCK